MYKPNRHEAVETSHQGPRQRQRYNCDDPASEFSTRSELSRNQYEKVARLVLKVKDNETVTISNKEDPAIYFQVVKQYLEAPDTSDFVRLEALGSAIPQLVTIAYLLESASIVQITKVRNKEQLVTYQS